MDHLMLISTVVDLAPWAARLDHAARAREREAALGLTRRRSRACGRLSQLVVEAERHAQVSIRCSRARASLRSCWSRSTVSSIGPEAPGTRRATSVRIRASA